MIAMLVSEKLHNVKAQNFAIFQLRTCVATEITPVAAPKSSNLSLFSFLNDK
jgi:hypothetical protein